MATQRKEASAAKFRSTDEFIQFMATEAVKDAGGKDRIDLDYSVDSIEKVEEILHRFHEQYAKDPSSIRAKGLGSAYGAYIAEVIRRSDPTAKWEQDDHVGGEKSYPIIWGPGAGHSYPMAWCYHRIVNGPEDNVWVKYQVLKDRKHKGPVAENEVSAMRKPAHLFDGRNTKCGLTGRNALPLINYVSNATPENS